MMSSRKRMDVRLGIPWNVKWEPEEGYLFACSVNFFWLINNQIQNCFPSKYFQFFSDIHLNFVNYHRRITCYRKNIGRASVSRCCWHFFFPARLKTAAKQTMLSKPRRSKPRSFISLYPADLIARKLQPSWMVWRKNIMELFRSRKFSSQIQKVKRW